jgi:hypothetical protein
MKADLEAEGGVRSEASEELPEVVVRELELPPLEHWSPGELGLKKLLRSVVNECDLSLRLVPVLPLRPIDEGMDKGANL